MKTIAVVNKKGGAGKTPTAVHLSFALAYAGKRVLFIDLDPQGTASLHFLGKPYRDIEPTVYDALVKLMPVQPNKINERLHVLSAKRELQKAEDDLRRQRGISWQYTLKELLVLYAGYDYCIIDTPGSEDSVFTIIALAAANFVMVPLKAEEAQEDALIDTMNLIREVQSPRGWNPKLRIIGIFLNQLENTLHMRDIVGILREDYHDLVYAEPSKKTTAFNEALSGRSDIREFDGSLGEYWDKVASFVVERSEIAA